jgi:two-component system cell cycle response regulator
MALRVLLADESSTIKKVFQLALQDFAVDVRPVNVGIDVVTVAQSFKPDIIFADVMLQKKSGYEVSADIKQNPALTGIPVVLMWSGFIELDEDKFQASHANAQLEKPFDVSALRKLVTDLVPRTQNQRLSQFLAFPKLPEFEESAPPAGAEELPPVPPAAAAVPEEEFKQMPIPKMKGDKYRLNLKPEELEPEHVPVDYEEPAEVPDIGDEAEEFTVRAPAPPAAPKASAATAARPPPPKPKPLEVEMVEAEDLGADEMAALAALGKPLPPAPPAMTVPSLTAAQLEKIIREQSAEVIESVVWKVVPDLAAQIIERELNRLLKDRESKPY